MNDLINQLKDFRSFRAIVVGDFMMDEFVYGDAERLSADAPVPVLLARRTETAPGGAANLCLDLEALGGTVHAVGVLGDDQEGRILRNLLEAQGIKTQSLITDETRQTTVKRNFIGLAQHRHPQKMFRVDFESRDELPSEAAESLLHAFDQALEHADVICIEDYNKGVCSEDVCQAIIAKAGAAGKPVFVDPASLDSYVKYKGCDAITPNRTEAERATNLRSDSNDTEQCAPLAVALQAVTEAHAVVLTLDRMGALLLEDTADPVIVPTLARAVYDVSGAGDMFIAALAAARANGLDWVSAVKLANAAAGLEVEKFGVEPIPLADIRRSLIAQSDLGPIRSLGELVEEVAAARAKGQRVVFTNGCFDILHPGHVSLVEQCDKLGEYVVVALNDDDSIRRLKGEGRPVNNEHDRARVLGALQGVDAVVLFSEDTPISLIEAIQPDVLVKGADYTKDEVVGAEVVEKAGGEVVLVEIVKGRSTTATIAKLDET